MEPSGIEMTTIKSHAGAHQLDFKNEKKVNHINQFKAVYKNVHDSYINQDSLMINIKLSTSCDLQ